MADAYSWLASGEEIAGIRGEATHRTPPDRRGGTPPTRKSTERRSPPKQRHDDAPPAAHPSTEAASKARLTVSKGQGGATSPVPHVLPPPPPPPSPPPPPAHLVQAVVGEWLAARQWQQVTDAASRRPYYFRTNSHGASREVTWNLAAVAERHLSHASHLGIVDDEEAQEASEPLPGPWEDGDNDVSNGRRVPPRRRVLSRHDSHPPQESGAQPPAVQKRVGRSTNAASSHGGPSPRAAAGTVTSPTRRGAAVSPPPRAKLVATASSTQKVGTPHAANPRGSDVDRRVTPKRTSTPTSAGAKWSRATPKAKSGGDPIATSAVKSRQSPIAGHRSPPPPASVTDPALESEQRHASPTARAVATAPPVLSPGQIRSPPYMPAAGAQTKTAHEAAAASSATFSQWHAKVTDLYRRCNPSKLLVVDELLRRYEGREQELWENLCSKYQPLPTATLLGESTVRTGIDRGSEGDDEGDGGTVTTPVRGIGPDAAASAARPLSSSVGLSAIGKRSPRGDGVGAEPPLPPRRDHQADAATPAAHLVASPNPKDPRQLLVPEEGLHDRADAAAGRSPSSGQRVDPASRASPPNPTALLAARDAAERKAFLVLNTPRSAAASTAAGGRATPPATTPRTVASAAAANGDAEGGPHIAAAISPRRAPAIVAAPTAAPTAGTPRQGRRPSMSPTSVKRAPLTPKRTADALAADGPQVPSPPPAAEAPQSHATNLPPATHPSAARAPVAAAATQPKSDAWCQELSRREQEIAARREAIQVARREAQEKRAQELARRLDDNRRKYEAEKLLREEHKAGRNGSGGSSDGGDGKPSWVN